MKDARGKNLELLVAVAPYCGVHHSVHEFVSELLRLVETNPAGVSSVLGKLIETYEPSYDYENGMKSLVARLAGLGQRLAALDYCNRLRNVPGMADLFAKLTAGS